MVVTFEQLPDLRTELADQSIVLRAGCYDLVHEGHLRGLKFAKEQGDVLVIGVHPDFRVTERKGPLRPIRPELARVAIVDALRCVDYCLVMPSNDNKIGHATLRVVDALRPDVFVAPLPPEGEPAHPNDEQIMAMGTKLVFDPNRAPHSTTEIIETILHKYGQGIAQP